jgi:hypothetical protein
LTTYGKQRIPELLIMSRDSTKRYWGFGNVMVNLILDNIGTFIVLAFIWWVWLMEVDAQLGREMKKSKEFLENVDNKPESMTMEEWLNIPRRPAIYPNNTKMFAFAFWIPSYFLVSGIAVGINWLVGLI